MSWDSETVSWAFLEAVAAVYGEGRHDHRCMELGRCVYDEKCPLIDTCTPTEYSE